MTEPTSEAAPPPERRADPPPRRVPIGAAACEALDSEASACEWCGADE